MQNCFGEPVDHSGLSHTKTAYRQAFTQAQDQLQRFLKALQSRYCCTTCAHSEVPELFTRLPESCGYRAWQQQALNLMQGELAQGVLEALKHINQTERNKHQCQSCGACCRLASSSYTYAELLAQAQAGDVFAQQFTSIFLPYASLEKAREAQPAMAAQAEAIAADRQEVVYFYHCPHITEDNRCGIYNTPKRPALCQSYPETPLVLMNSHCAWQPWQQEHLPQTLLAHASLSLLSDGSAKLEKLLSN